MQITHLLGLVKATFLAKEYNVVWHILIIRESHLYVIPWEPHQSLITTLKELYSKIGHLRMGDKAEKKSSGY